MWGMSASSVTSANGSRLSTVGAGGYLFMPSGATQTMMALQGGGGNGVMPAVAPPLDRSQEVCKYFVNGGCLRGANCPYLHELPDERHLDVNGLGFILNPNVHNAQKTVLPPQSQLAGSTTSQPTKTTSSPLSAALNGHLGGGNRGFLSAKAAKNHPPSLGGSSSASPPTAPTGKLPAPPRYNPPEPFLELNLPPALAFPMKTPPKDAAAALAQVMLRN